MDPQQFLQFPHAATPGDGGIVRYLQDAAFLKGVAT
jgi:hypothetical protein